MQSRNLYACNGDVDATVDYGLSNINIMNVHAIIIGHKNEFRMQLTKTLRISYQCCEHCCTSCLLCFVNKTSTQALISQKSSQAANTVTTKQSAPRIAEHAARRKSNSSLNELSYTPVDQHKKLNVLSAPNGWAACSRAGSKITTD